MFRQKRVPKAGCFFKGVRITGLLFKIAGALMLLGGLLGFILTFIKSAPDLLEGFRYIDQQFAQLVITLIFTYLGVFIVLGCTGLLSFGLGFLLDRVATDRPDSIPQTSIDNPDASI